MKRHNIKLLGKNYKGITNRAAAIDSSCGCSKPLPKPVTKKTK
jgi:hypothetical protein